MKPDSQLQQDVMAELQREPGGKATQIGVEVNDGVVTPDGEVDSDRAKLSAEPAARRAAGMTALAVAMKVKPNGVRGSPGVRNVVDHPNLVT